MIYQGRTQSMSGFIRADFPLPTTTKNVTLGRKLGSYISYNSNPAGPPARQFLFPAQRDALWAKWLADKAAAEKKHKPVPPAPFTPMYGNYTLPASMQTSAPAGMSGLGARPLPGPGPGVPRGPIPPRISVRKLSGLGFTVSDPLGAKGDRGSDNGKTPTPPSSPGFSMSGLLPWAVLGGGALLLFAGIGGAAAKGYRVSKYRTGKAVAGAHVYEPL